MTTDAIFLAQKGKGYCEKTTTTYQVHAIYLHLVARRFAVGRVSNFKLLVFIFKPIAFIGYIEESGICDKAFFGKIF